MVKPTNVEIDLTYGVFIDIFLCFESYYKVTKCVNFKITLYYGKFKLLFPCFSFAIAGRTKNVLPVYPKGVIFFLR